VVFSLVCRELGSTGMCLTVIHNTHLCDENEILLLLFQLYFEAITASNELFVFVGILKSSYSVQC